MIPKLNIRKERGRPVWNVWDSNGYHLGTIVCARRRLSGPVYSPDRALQQSIGEAFEKKTIGGAKLRVVLGYHDRVAALQSKEAKP